MINRKLIEDIFHHAINLGGDFAEVFLEDNFTTEIATVDGNIERGMAGRDFGIGIRIFSGLRSVYGYSNKVDRDSLLALTDKLAKALRAQGQIQMADFREVQPVLHPAKILPSSVDFKKKISYTKRAFDAAKAYDPMISQVTVNHLDQEQHVMIANTEGAFVEDTRVRTRMLINVAAQNGDVIETGYIGPGALKGLEFYKEISIEDYAREAARNAKVMALADHAPSGNMPVVVDNGFGGLMFHEACGHSLEASSVAKGLSVFSGKIGEQVASDVLSLVDDGSILNEWGSLGVDDEGMKTQKNVLIKDGILQGYMIDKLNGRRMDMEPTASSRRQNYRFAPTSRMTNTYIDNGKSTRDEIISSTERGLFAKNLSAGSVNPATGDFNFSLSEAYLIEDGKITKPVRGATLIGNGAQILKDVDMVADNLKIGQGYCYAGSGALFIGAGQPTIRVKSMTVGGRG